MKDVNIVEGSTQTKIADSGVKKAKFVYVFESLNAVQGDLISITCFNDHGKTFGAGCFVLNNNCHCFNLLYYVEGRFNANIPKCYNFNNIECSISIHSLDVNNIAGNFTFQHYIPLDASRLSCKNADNVLFVLYGENHSINLRDYIIADFELKNLEIIITENYKYFYLNDSIQLIQNQKFKILNDITFNSKESQKFHIIFENQGIVLNNTKECDFYIRVCHEGCLQCLDEDITKRKHQCIECRDGFYIVENTNN